MGPLHWCRCTGAAALPHYLSAGYSAVGLRPLGDCTDACCLLAPLAQYCAAVGAPQRARSAGGRHGGRADVRQDRRLRCEGASHSIAAPAPAPCSAARTGEGAHIGPPRSSAAPVLYAARERRTGDDVSHPRLPHARRQIRLASARVACVGRCAAAPCRAVRRSPLGSPRIHRGARRVRVGPVPVVCMARLPRGTARRTICALRPLAAAHAAACAPPLLAATARTDRPRSPLSAPACSSVYRTIAAPVRPSRAASAFAWACKGAPASARCLPVPPWTIGVRCARAGARALTRTHTCTRAPTHRQTGPAPAAYAPGAHAHVRVAAQV